MKRLIEFEILVLKMAYQRSSISKDDFPDMKIETYNYSVESLRSMGFLKLLDNSHGSYFGYITKEGIKKIKTGDL